jgi:hypothetical protein
MTYLVTAAPGLLVIKAGLSSTTVSAQSHKDIYMYLANVFHFFATLDLLLFFPQ